jgi:tetratricopeptide (TPR) repeat protein
MAVGTPAYMSPEQGMGSGELDGRSDIYSLGCVLYEMLAGTPPFVGATVEALVHQHITAKPAPVTQVRQSVPAEVVEALERALAKTPADRYATAAQLVEVLRVPTTTPTAVPVVRKKPFAMVAVAAVAVIAVLVIGALLLPRSGVAVNPDRVVVAVLSNQTGDPSLDRVGYMAGDWITQGLQEVQVLQVVPWPTAQRSSMWVESGQQVGRVRDPLRALAAETGASVVISGAYYREGESIRFSIQINDASRGELLVALEPVEGSADSVSGIVDRVRGSVMGSMAVLFDERFANWVGIAQQPPSPSAYREFSVGMERYIRRQYVDAAPHFQRAAALDPTFVQAPLFLAIALLNIGESARVDSVVQDLDRRRGSMTSYDRLWLDGLRALLEGNHDAYLNFMRRAAEMAPGSKAVYNRGFGAIRGRRPSEAVEAFLSLDPERGAMRGWNPYFRWLTVALHSLEEYEEELDAALRGAELYPGSSVTFRYQVRALAALDRVEDALSLLGANGELTVPPWYVMKAGNTLFRHGHHQAAETFYERVIAWYEAQQSGTVTDIDDRSAYGNALLYTERHREAREVFEQLSRDRPNSPGWLGKVGVAAAWDGDHEEARAIDARLATMDRPFLYGEHTVARAFIAASLGEQTRAVQLLREAHSDGAWSGVLDWHSNPELQSLWDFLPYQEFMRPKG